jgi:chromosome segregation ATPase
MKLLHNKFFLSQIIFLLVFNFFSLAFADDAESQISNEINDKVVEEEVSSDAQDQRDHLIDQLNKDIEENEQIINQLNKDIEDLKKNKTINVDRINVLEDQIEISTKKNTSLEQDMDTFMKYGAANSIFNVKTLILSLLILLVILLIVMTLALRKTILWRKESLDKVVNDGNVIAFPHEMNEYIKDYLNNMAHYVQENGNTMSSMSSEVKDVLTNLHEQLSIFRTKIESSEDDLKRYKNGYDFKIKKDYLLHLIKLNSICLAEKNTENDTLIALSELIEDYFDQENIKKYELEINNSIQGQRECRSITENTNDEQKAGLVVANIEPGYLVKQPEGETILKSALVKILKYEK